MPFELEAISDSTTFSLIGVNETGKSNILKALALLEQASVSYPQDFYDTGAPVVIDYIYDASTTNLNGLRESLVKKGAGKDLVNAVKPVEVTVTVSFSNETTPARTKRETIVWTKDNFGKYTEKDGVIVEKHSDDGADFSLSDFCRQYHPTYFYGWTHNITVWKSEDKYLINNEIDLNTFAEKPSDVSVPLFNCFKLAKIDEDSIKTEIGKTLSDPASINNLQKRLSDAVTTHIKEVWPNHPIKVGFQINGGKISFLIEDEKVDYRAKTTSQRSDGFKQFVSFLLTVSADHATEELHRTLLLLDEPETHLHPQAQEFLLDELIDLTNNDFNNIVVFATHSNYMIDKENLQRSLRVTKNGDRTAVNPFSQRVTSYSEVNYEVFSIVTHDYHNELYGYLEDTTPNTLDALEKKLTWKNAKTGRDETVSLQKYIRNHIHHPENTQNKPPSRQQLLQSIKKMRELKYGSE